MTTICNPALSTKPIPTCISSLVIGAIADINTQVTIIIEDITTGRREVYNSISSAAGAVTANVSSAEFSDSHSYQSWIYKTNISDPYFISIGNKQSQYIKLTFEKCFDDGEVVSQTSVTLEAE